VAAYGQALVKLSQKNCLHHMSKPAKARLAIPFMIQSPGGGGCKKGGGAGKYHRSSKSSESLFNGAV
jgi:hypothetical protein